jgi:hypothetical protein
MSKDIPTISIPTFAYDTIGCDDYERLVSAREIEQILHDTGHVGNRVLASGVYSTGDYNCSTNHCTYWKYRGLFSASENSTSVNGTVEIEVATRRTTRIFKDVNEALSWLRSVVQSVGNRSQQKPKPKVLRQQKLKFKYKQGSRYMVRGVKSVALLPEGLKYTAEYSRNGIKINEAVVVPYKDLEAVEHQHPTENYKTYVFKFSKLVQIIETIKNTK